MATGGFVPLWQHRYNRIRKPRLERGAVLAFLHVELLIFLDVGSKLARSLRYLAKVALILY